MSHLRMVVLGSSSKGNSTLIEAREGSILVDAGFSCREITRRMAVQGADMRDLQALVVTHEHTDHISGVRVLAGRYDLPVIATPGTLMAARGHLGGARTVPLDHGGTLRQGPFDVTLLPIPHDARQPAAVRVESGDRRLLVATDIGQFPWALIEEGQDMDALVLESNHDARMLRTGPYPEFLKRRIQGPQGHLSNDESAVALRALLGPRTRAVLLGHLSQKNNTEELALRTVLSGVPEPIREGVDIRTTAPDRAESVDL